MCKWPAGSAKGSALTAPSSLKTRRQTVAQALLPALLRAIRLSLGAPKPFVLNCLRICTYKNPRGEGLKLLRIG